MQQTVYQHESLITVWRLSLEDSFIVINNRLSQICWLDHFFFRYSVMSPVTYQCCSQVRTSLPDRSCFRCSRKCNARRTRPLADRTCCTRSRSSARRSWLVSGTQTEPPVRCESASASVGWGWSCQNERLSLLTSHLRLKREFWHRQQTFQEKKRKNK